MAGRLHPAWVGLIGFALYVRTVAYGFVLHDDPWLIRDNLLLHEEDVDVLGLSILSGAHRELFPEIMRLLREQGADDLLVFAGGVIPDEDIAFCEEIGIRAVFGPGSPVDAAIQVIEENVKP